MEEREREQQLKMLKEQNQELLRKKERVLSACGIRKNYVCTFFSLFRRISPHSSAQERRCVLYSSSQQLQADQEGRNLAS